MQDNIVVGKTASGVEQDGVHCPRKAPWAPWVGWITTLMFLPLVAVAVVVLAQTSVWKLLVWLLVLWALLVPLRYFVCARCPYYGDYCSSLFGKTTPFVFRKQHGSMKVGLWMDVVAVAILFVLPIPDMFRYGGIATLMLWLALFGMAFLILFRVACRPCPFTFCPIGSAGDLAWDGLDLLWRRIRKSR
ncbi:MAG: hypothetical protein ACLFOY_09080 [Desulfatibacillaceae bacterium]